MEVVEIRFYSASFGNKSHNNFFTILKRTRLKLPFLPKSVSEVDFNGYGREGKEIIIRDNLLKFEVKPWEIVTLRVDSFEKLQNFDFQ